MAIVENVEYSLMVITILKSVLTDSEADQLAKLKSYNYKILSKEQKEELERLETKANSSFTSQDVYQDFFKSPVSFLTKQIKDFAKKTANLQVIPIPVPKALTPLITRDVEVNLEKVTDRFAIKRIGNSGASLTFTIPIDDGLNPLFLILEGLYTKYLESLESTVKISFFSLDGILLQNCLIVSSVWGKETITSNKYNFQLTVVRLKDPTILAVPTSKYELIG